MTTISGAVTSGRVLNRKRLKTIAVIIMIFSGSFLLSGCFFGSDGGGSSIPEGEVLRADFSMRESSGRLYLDASSTEVEGYSNPEYAWRVNGTSYAGEKIDMTTPNSETDIKLTVKAHKDNDTVTDSITKAYKPGGISDGDVNFSYSRIGTREYRFVGTEPTGSVYWEWKIEGGNWYGYKNDNEYTHKFNSSGHKEVELRILDSSENVIGHKTKTVDVY